MTWDAGGDQSPPTQSNTGSGGGDVWGAIIGGALSAFGASRANRKNLDEAERNRNWQKYMSGTAVQRRMRDMAAAGINPILAGRYDASTPPGNIAHNMSNEGSAAVEGAQSAMNIKTQKENLKLLKAQRWNVEADTRLKGDQGFAAWQQGNRVNAEIGQINSAARLNVTTAEFKEMETALGRIDLAQRKWLFGDGDRSPTREQAVNYMVKEFGIKRSVALKMYKTFSRTYDAVSRTPNEYDRRNNMD